MLPFNFIQKHPFKELNTYTFCTMMQKNNAVNIKMGHELQWSKTHLRQKSGLLAID